jgi:hypothetical protein
MIERADVYLDGPGAVSERNPHTGADRGNSDWWPEQTSGSVYVCWVRRAIPVMAASRDSGSRIGVPNSARYSPLAVSSDLPDDGSASLDPSSRLAVRKDQAEKAGNE